MPSFALISSHREVQTAAKTVLECLAAQISATDSEQSIAGNAYNALCKLGFPETWYYACPAFVLAGSRSCLSVSGRDYLPNNEPIGTLGVVSVDLSPMRNGHWGDCARSYYIENGCVTSTPRSPELNAGKQFLVALHDEMKRMVQPDMSFHELYAWTNQRIKSGGFENLDFLGNVGHSIATRREDRQYIQADNRVKLRDVPFFTFEPHVREVGGRWGFKRENIFFFNEYGSVEEL